MGALVVFKCQMNNNNHERGNKHRDSERDRESGIDTESSPEQEPRKRNTEQTLVTKGDRKRRRGRGKPNNRREGERERMKETPRGEAGKGNKCRRTDQKVDHDHRGSDAHLGFLRMIPTGRGIQSKTKLHGRLISEQTNRARGRAKAVKQHRSTREN